MNYLEENFTVKSYETDLEKRLKVQSFLNFAQFMAEKHADSLSFGYKDLIAKNLFWVLSRIDIEFLKFPTWNQEITMKTWHKGVEALFGLRDFIIRSNDGKELVKATSSWLILDSVSRRLQRVDKILGSTGRLPHSEDAILESAPKVNLVEEMFCAAERRVTYSDMDLNLHTNNAKYIEWSLDFMAERYGYEREVKRLQINFNSESKMGDLIQIWIGSSKEEPNRIVVEGRRDESSVFRAQFWY